MKKEIKNYTIEERIDFFQEELALAEAKAIHTQRRIEWLVNKLIQLDEELKAEKTETKES